MVYSLFLSISISRRPAISTPTMTNLVVFLVILLSCNAELRSFLSYEKLKIIISKTYSVVTASDRSFQDIYWSLQLLNKYDKNFHMAIACESIARPSIDSMIDIYYSFKLSSMCSTNSSQDHGWRDKIIKNLKVYTLETLLLLF